MAKQSDSPKPRYGIAEWYGRDISSMSPNERNEVALIAKAQADKQHFETNPPCPFLSAIVSNSTCNKIGGVCTIRKYARTSDGFGAVVKGERISTLCPIRFLDGTRIIRWVGEKMLGTGSPIIVKETPFLRKLNVAASDNDELDDETKRAGRIDWILVHPDSIANDELKWCAVETQAVYFSGDAMEHEFSAYASSANEALIFPAGKRRPDYRSSGPKRLAPQLSVKVPVLRAWGKKIAVVVDRYFYDNMSELKSSFPRAKTEADHLANSEVIWFVVDYDGGMQMQPHQVVYSNLDYSVDALNATEPVNKDEFNANLRELIKDTAREGSKVFTLL